MTIFLSVLGVIYLVGVVLLWGVTIAEVVFNGGTIAELTKLEKLGNYLGGLIGFILLVVVITLWPLFGVGSFIAGVVKDIRNLGKNKK